MSDTAPAQEVTADAKIALAGLILENATQFLASLWLSLSLLEIVVDDHAKARVKEILEEVSKQIEILKTEQGLFKADAPKQAVFH